MDKMLGVWNAEGGCDALEINKNPYRIGRDSENDLVFENLSISRRHAQIERASDGTYYLKDLGSTNGTLVNDQRLGVDPRPLAEDDRITIGVDPDQVDIFFASHLSSDPRRTTQIVVDRGEGNVNLLSIGLQLDLGARELRLNGRPLKPGLTKRQFDILALLWQRNGLACTLEDIARTCWQERKKPVDNQEIHTYMHRIRKTLKKGGLEQEILHNVRGYGYKMRVILG